ncbi:long-chain fatty acid--CoA ligase [Nocardioides sp. TRM66260-LWL]|uniref:AMP-dependent synthetase/ligase n=1 Tax=Nocardioides sp. TRM66260-LWL TaxID=2874478 RepID=UPI001CC7CB50|nr:long-chain fatty acid--CoA ligase [Nocardioides sp. TRM66260-LWL]MBZ5735871.1 long-chain fatty acid--CoA ligase [Nocardioides sp. TRM66260-LWL]
MAIVRDTSFVDHLPRNVAVQFLDRVATSPDVEAFRFPVGTAWESITWRQAGREVERLAAGLRSLGLEAEDRVGIAAGTRYEWILADLAIMLAGGATTTVYPSTNADDVAYILSDSGSRVVFAEDAEQVAKLVEFREQLPEVLRVVTFEKVDAPDAPEGWVTGLEQLAAEGDAWLAEHPGQVEETARAIAPDALATLIYTSGTTGRPKGVRLLHRSWVYEGEAIRVQDILHEDDLQFLWLPMAHAFGKVLLSAQLACGFATAIDGRVDKIIDNLAVVRPTFMGAAPRIFEKAYGRIITMTESEGGAKQKIFEQAFKVGTAVDELRRAGKAVPLPLRVQHALFDRLVFAKVRERFGGRVKFFISGSAALNADIANWFHAAGILILEGYGMTENAAGAAVNHPQDYKIGTVGPALPGTEIRIGEGDEVLIRGPHVMAGYHNLPEETAKALDADGWLHTGDKGSLDADGHLRITGRIKDLFKTSGGKYIAPPAIEAKFKAICPLVSQFMVFGNERNYCVALITIDPDAATAWAAENGVTGDYAAITRDERLRAEIGRYVEELNSKLNRWETIKKWEILDHDLSIESGELTPSLKVKRNVVEQRNKERIDAFYA